MMVSSTLITFTYFVSVSFALDECYHAWSVRGEPATCSASTPCLDANAQCVFSFVTGTHICCKPQDGATMPECPNHRILLTTGKFASLTCTPGDDDGNDACPAGFQCVPSLTDFTRDAGQPQFVCCRV
ncbi:hypothetical protein Tcan_15110 [Toxocara canis]|uniref:Uncharacterized protein n=1 Tax=Toxocara canis TaxID=6265 RepID=A0A0B2W145_TOXCA|nr:hypothetical protein Tcan_15110 [Toxocara canis]